MNDSFHRLVKEEEVVEALLDLSDHLELQEETGELKGPSKKAVDPKED